jgi:hypothetical protein
MYCYVENQLSPFYHRVQNQFSSAHFTASSFHIFSSYVFSLSRWLTSVFGSCRRHCHRHHRHHHHHHHHHHLLLLLLLLNCSASNVQLRISSPSRVLDFRGKICYKIHSFRIWNVLHYRLVIRDPDITDFVCNEQNLGVYNFKFLETLKHQEGNVVRKPCNIKKNPNIKTFI